jgi:hypothetical protein
VIDDQVEVLAIDDAGHEQGFGVAGLLAVR